MLKIESPRHSIYILIKHYWLLLFDARYAIKDVDLIAIRNRRQAMVERILCGVSCERCSAYWTILRDSFQVADYSKTN